MKIIATVSLLSSLIVIGAGIGATFLRDVLTSILEIVLSFGLAALSFLVAEVSR